jgi:hypothetical protein
MTPSSLNPQIFNSGLLMRGKWHPGGQNLTSLLCLCMTLLHDPEPQAKPYATERRFVDQHTFVEIEFYKDGEAHRVWPYIGHAGVESYIGKTKFISDGKRHFVVPGAFETQAAARESANVAAQHYLAMKDWQYSLA